MPYSKKKSCKMTLFSGVDKKSSGRQIKWRGLPGFALVAKDNQNRQRPLCAKCRSDKLRPFFQGVEPMTLPAAVNAG